MDYSFEDFIYQSNLEKKQQYLCNVVIERYEKSLPVFSTSNDEPLTKRNDEAVFVTEDYCSAIFEALGPHVNNYIKESNYDGNLYLDSVKLQKTEPGGGYHVWHSEKTGGFLSGQLRELTYTIYLNDVDEGGETEFLMQHRRVQPKKGLLLIWPAYFTHKHRGNPPLKGEKYIATGWILNAKTNQPA